MAKFSEKEWQGVLAQLKSVIGAEADRYANIPAAKLYASIAYLADSEDADRFALSNLLTFHAATKAAVFDHRESDNESPLRRLAAFHVGKKADKKVVKYGLTLLALISVNDHVNDVEADKKAKKYNPINAGAWKGAAQQKKLKATLDRDTELKKTYAPLGKDLHAMGFWNS